MGGGFGVACFGAVEDEDFFTVDVEPDLLTLAVLPVGSASSASPETSSVSLSSSHQLETPLST